MTWSKLSDDFSDDCWTLSDAAFRLHVEGIVWDNRKLLDRRIPKADVQRFKRPDALVELLATGWWSDDGDAYLIRHHASYQRLREDVLKQQEANRANGRRGGRPPKPAREQAPPPGTQPQTDSVPKSHSLSDSLSESKTERDRTGRALEDGTNITTAWPARSVPGGCSVCHQPYVSPDGSQSHPTCDPLEAIA